MKEKIMLFVIGILVGAIISTGAVYVYTKANACNNTNNGQTMQMPGGDPRGMPNGQNGEPPTRPEDNQNNTQNNNNN